MSVLDQIREAADAKGEAQAALDERSEALNGLVREACAQGLTAVRIAEASGLSKPRIYQIRDHR
ncbi:hypothetical protein [Paeniglutamicibacter kerguelensis]|uniref:Helix-turn-helix domain-containing protein n=1 Tax=Paeniglutamicibacter kerguelensis TaxID=254788 RepID=A0ABS4XA72_9MICC|nr:hypothetical protein [Paeniglutamicibacter kerguelensis]MBP2385357.1 hypothetical protein [Paeniglutamicibacter kerguelensis]